MIGFFSMGVFYCQLFLLQWLCWLAPRQLGAQQP